MTAKEYVMKAIAAIIKLPEAQFEKFFQNPQDYAFDVEAEKFYKLADVQFKTFIDLDELNAALNEGWKIDKVLNWGELPTKIQVRKRFYLEPESSL